MPSAEPFRGAFSPMTPVTSSMISLTVKNTLDCLRRALNAQGGKTSGAYILPADIEKQHQSCRENEQEERQRQRGHKKQREDRIRRRRNTLLCLCHLRLILVDKPLNPRQRGVYPGRPLHDRR